MLVNINPDIFVVMDFGVANTRIAIGVNPDAGSIVTEDITILHLSLSLFPNQNTSLSIAMNFTASQVRFTFILDANS